MDMTLFNVAAGVFLGNALTLSVIVSVKHFEKHKGGSSWLSLWGTLVPLGFVGLIVLAASG